MNVVVRQNMKGTWYMVCDCKDSSYYGNTGASQMFPWSMREYKNQSTPQTRALRAAAEHVGRWHPQEANTIDVQQDDYHSPPKWAPSPWADK